MVYQGVIFVVLPTYRELIIVKTHLLIGKQLWVVTEGERSLLKRYLLALLEEL